MKTFLVNSVLLRATRCYFSSYIDIESNSKSRSKVICASVRWLLWPRYKPQSLWIEQIDRAKPIENEIHFLLTTLPNNCKNAHKKLNTRK